jgi:UDP-N-acetylmuramate dehydrogenase
LSWAIHHIFKSKESSLSLTVLEVGDALVQYQAPLSLFTTFRLGGSCPALITCRTPDQLEQVVQSLTRENRRFILIGGGSNLVVSDEGVDCYVVRYLSGQPIIERDGHDIVVSGSTLLDDLARYALEQGLEGLNYTGGIPGTVGGAVVGNAGAFGRQVGDVVKSVKVLCRDKSARVTKDIGAGDLRFSYRDSALKSTDDIVLSVRFALNPGDRETLQKERDEILRLRGEKHPDLTTYPCAGSFFRNVEPTSRAGQRQAAGWFLERAGGKGLAYGGAKIFDKHANIIVKSEGCRAQDVFELSGRMAELVRENFGLNLIREVRFVGKFQKMPPEVQNTIW